MPNFYLMRGRDTVCAPILQPAWVYWAVQDNPDPTAARCPVANMICGANPPVDLTDIAIAERYVLDYSWPDARVLNVGQDERMFPSVTAAVASIPLLTAAPSVNNRLCIYVWPGKYTTNAIIDVPNYTSIHGVSRCLTMFQNDATAIFRAAGPQVYFENFLIAGSPTAGIYALDLNNQSGCEVRDVTMLHNGFAARQWFLRQSGATWATLFVENCIVDGYHIGGELVLLENTDAAASRAIDTHFTNCFFDAFHLVNQGGVMKVRGCHDAYIRVGSLFRVNPIANATAVRLERAGVAAGTPAVEIHHSSIIANPAAASVRTELNTNWVSVNAYLDNAVFTGTHLEFNSTI